MIGDNEQKAMADKAYQQTNTTALPNHEEPITEFRNQCRKFYRRSTSVMQSSGSLLGLLDEDVKSNGSANLPLKNDDENDKKSRVVVEAIERLVEESHNTSSNDSSPQQQKSYASFLKAQSAENIDILTSCGLPTTEDDARKIQGDALDHLIAIRTEERKQAHEVKMLERYHMLQDILVEMTQTTVDANIDPPTFVTTRNDLRRMRRIIREFVRKYHDSAIASHPFLAGIRKALRMQVGSNSEVPVECTVVWTLDGAVLTEAVKTSRCGAGGDDAYVRDAVGVISSFMTWRRNGIKSSNDEDHKLNFEINPALSDRTLEKLLEVVPKEKDLHGRPTGIFDVGNTKRNNIEAEQDEIDFCAQIFRETFKNLKIGPRRK